MEFVQHHFPSPRSLHVFNHEVIHIIEGKKSSRELLECRRVDAGEARSPDSFSKSLAARKDGAMQSASREWTSMTEARDKVDLGKMRQDVEKRKGAKSARSMVSSRTRE